MASSIASSPPMPYPGLPAGAAGVSVPSDLRQWIQDILAGNIEQPLYRYEQVNGEAVPVGVYPVPIPVSSIPAGNVLLYRTLSSALPDPNGNKSMKDRLASLVSVGTTLVKYPGSVPTGEVIYYANRAKLTEIATQAESNANALWSKAWSGSGFDANYQTWLEGVASDPLRGATGVKVSLAIEVSSALRTKSEELLRINTRMTDMNAVLKKLNGIAADAKSKADTDQISYAEGIAMGSSYTGGNAWAANVKPLWDSWGVDTSKFQVVSTGTGVGKLVIEKRYIDVAMESLKIALDKASSEAQQLQLDLNNIMTQYNGQFDAASAIYQRKNSLDQALQPRG